MVFPAGLELILGSLDLVPGLPGEDYWSFNSLPVLWPWYRACLVKVPGCLGSLPGSQYLVPWLYDERPWLPMIASWFAGLGSLVAW